MLAFGLLVYYKIKCCRARQNELFDHNNLEEQDQDNSRTEQQKSNFHEIKGFNWWRWVLFVDPELEKG